VFPQIFGKYVLEAELAAGGMARVYLATLRGADGFEKRLVVKQIRPELASDEAFVERFVEEAKTAVELSHPNIVPVYELGVEQGVYYIAMERCEGSTLAELLDAAGPLSPEEGAHLGAEVCRALDYAHRKAGVVHRDVTPRNVLIDEEGAVRLIDFGIAAPTEEPGGHGKREIFGSPGHMPPEQIRGDALTPATDVFATAVLLLEAWTGEPPFRRATPRESHRALESVPPELGLAVPDLAPVSDLIRAALSLDPARRPKDAEQLGRPLRDLLRRADSVDVARRLGERVRCARRHRSAAPAADGAGVSGATPSTKRVEAPRTPASASRTFAARQDLVEWTRRLSSVPPAPGGEPAQAPSPESKRVGQSPESSTAGAAPEGVGSSAGNDPIPGAPSSRSVASRRFVGSGRAAVTASVVVGSLALAVWWATASRGSGPAEARMVLTGAAPQAVPRATGKGWTQRSAGSPAAADGGTTGAALAPSRSTRASASAQETGPQAVAAGEPPSIATSSTGASTAGPSSPVPAAVFGELKLTSVPQASVTVEGRAYTTPVAGVRLRAGSHRVTFRNETWEGPVSTQVVLKAGDHRSVHADFTSEPPRVIVR
jgi:serine/threonine-protein kinase